MCGIAGILSLERRDISRDLKRMLVAIKHRGPDGSGIVINDKFNYGNLESLVFPRGNIGIGHNRLGIIGRGLQPIPNENKELWIVHNGEIYNHKSVKKNLSNHVFMTDIDSEVILHAYEEGRLDLLDGDYAFAIYNSGKEEIVVVRDAIGIRPVFYCFDGSLFVFASERKAFRNICNRAIRLLPGHKITASYDGVIVERFDDIPFNKNKYRDLDRAENDLLKALEESVEKRLYPSLGVLFSGGIDSSIIAKLASEHDCELKLITVGLEESIDLLRARKVASLLGLDLEEYVIKKEDVFEVFAKVIRIIDEPDPIKAMIGIPIYVAAKLAREIGLKVILAGQGADELFGGYMKYLNEKDLERRLMYDIINLHKVNLERDDHCTMSNSVELRLPYLDRDVIKVATRIPITFKIKKGVRKWILRRIGKRIGLPTESIQADKKAIQYGTRVAYILKKTAKKMGKDLKTLALDIFKGDN